MPKKSRDGKPQSRVRPYQFFLRESRAQRDQDGQEPSRISCAEFTRQCAKRWKTMTKQERTPFVQQSAKDKDRFKLEMKEHMESTDHDQPPARKKPKKDPNAPKGPLCPFFFFCSEQRANVRATLGCSRMSTIATELGRLWTAVSLDDRVKYNLMADDAKERYLKEMAVYTQKKGEIEEAVAAQMTYSATTALALD